VSEQLKPCPWCGSNYLHTEWGLGEVRCKTCNAIGPNAGQRTQSSAIAGWNARTDDSLRAQLATVTAERDKLQRDFDSAADEVQRVLKEKHDALAQRDEARGLVNRFAKSRARIAQMQCSLMTYPIEMIDEIDTEERSIHEALSESAARWAKEQA